MLFARQIRASLFALLACLALIGIAAAFWAITGRNSLLLREDNPRRVEALARIQRGSISDRHSRILAETVATDSGLLRRYLSPATYSLTGYYSLRYGVSGAEAAFDDLLSGARPLTTLSDYFNQQILRLPQVGSDIMLTIDAEIQVALANAMEGANGAAIVLDAASGALLALLSQPTFDPNRLDQDWSQLIEAEGNPFFNRALQGNYQLGGNIYLLWLAQAIGADYELSLRFTDAATPVTLDDDTVIRCTTQPASSDLTLPEALSFGCPAPFNSYRQTGSASSYDKLVSTYRLADPVVLPGFPQPEQLPASAAHTELAPQALDLRNALGQGELTTTPLHIATIMAAIANDGIAKMPWLHAAQREPESDKWRPAQPTTESLHMLDAETARTTQSILRQAWLQLTDDQPPPPIEVGAYLAMSHSGDETQLWLNGYIKAADDNTAAFVILLENTADTERLFTIGTALVEALS